MKYTRQFIDEEQTKQKDDFIAKIRRICESDGFEQLDYQEHDGFRRWLYYTPKFSPSGFVQLKEVGTLIRCPNSLKPGWEVTEAQIIDHCLKYLADYKKPRSVDFVREMPMSSAGKILKRVIRDKYWKGRERRV